MLTRSLTNTLRLASEGRLPAVVDEADPALLDDVRTLYRWGFLAAKDACADSGDCYMQPAITIAGLRQLHAELGT